MDVNGTLLENVPQVFIQIEAKDIYPVCNFLFKSPSYYFDFLNCVTAIDNGVESGTIDLIYTMTSIVFNNSLIIKVKISREINENAFIETVSTIWKTADWHEREIFDFFGVKFGNHPDLRRILLPADWEGHPLRKDYEEQEIYHGIKVKY